MYTSTRIHLFKLFQGQRRDQSTSGRHFKTTNYGLFCLVTILCFFHDKHDLPAEIQIQGHS